MAPQDKAVSRKPRLGKGLASLIINSSAAEPADETYSPVPRDQAVPEAPPVQGRLGEAEAQMLAVDKIGPNPYQPRREFADAEMAELAASIVAQGILQPIIVCRAGEATGDGDRPYVLIAGERRLRAAQRAGLAEVPCMIRQGTRQQMLEWALVENIQRADLNPIERANAYREFMDRFNLSQADAAERLSEPRATVANYLRLLDLPDEIQQMLLTGKLTFGHAKVLAGLAGDTERQLALARKASAGNMSVRQLEGLIEAGQAPGETATPRRRRTKPPHILDLEEQLSSTVGTRVRIQPGRAKNSGRIVVDYYSLDDFDRIAGSLGLERDR